MPRRPHAARKPARRDRQPWLRRRCGRDLSRSTTSVVAKRARGIEAENAAFERARDAVRARLPERARDRRAGACATSWRRTSSCSTTRNCSRRRAPRFAPARARASPGVPASARQRARLNATGDARLAERVDDLRDLERQVLLRTRRCAGDQRPEIAPRQHPGGARSHPFAAHRYRHQRSSPASRWRRVGPPRMWPFSPATLGIPMLVSVGRRVAATSRTAPR